MGMPMSIPHLPATLAVMLLFCLVFLRAKDLHVLGRLRHRSAVSLAGGAAVAYVFVDLSPELQAAATDFRESTAHLGSHLLHYGVPLATMAGFLLFYGVEELVIRSREPSDRERRRESKQAHPLFRIHLSVFAAYAWMVGYLLVRSQDHTGVQLTFYAVAMTLHFLGVAHQLEEEHGLLYDRIGGKVLAAGCVAGWACGLAFGLPEPVTGVLLGVVAGGIMANTMISELPREREGKFGPFLGGAAAYSCLLVLAK